MDNTCDTEMHAEWAWYYRTLPKSKQYEAFKCRDCGTEVVWAVSKKGNTYLAEKATWRSDAHSSDNGRTNERAFYPFHKCEADVEYQERYRKAMELVQADREQQIADGAVVVGQTVEVVKGRKIPKGVRGVIFWIADSADGYGVVKVGFKTETGEKHFTNITNVAAIK